MANPTAALSGSSERFGLRLATNLGLAQPHSNVAVSPLLLQTALALLFAGITPSSAPTAQQLARSFGAAILGTPDQALQQFQQLLGNLKQEVAIGCQLRLLSEFYTQQRYTFSFRDEFEARAGTLGIGVQRLDFNNWATTTSVGELVSSHLLESSSASDTPFLHVSALTFRAPWAQAFDAQETQCINFFPEGSHNAKLVDAMFLQHRFPICGAALVGCLRR
ncbi:leukocyte elastase inhibitor-like [Drosophila hydei]|uniref:Leukocyte elastase inhibitor-like n=1 Tax=Drosophila hydei TaxID=7224 RepID=A0A6J2SS04_DROHY|nr:leukocyte elastase inhibitor-like [Drosophila hydei]